MASRPKPLAVGVLSWLMGKATIPGQDGVCDSGEHKREPGQDAGNCLRERERRMRKSGRWPGCSAAKASNLADV